MYIRTAIKLSTLTRPVWMKRLGVAGFMFFLLKGMAWILIPWLVHSATF